MRYGVATLIAVLLLLAGIALTGAGHGWMAGAVGCFVLAPVSFLAAANGLSHAPSVQGAVALLILGLVLCFSVGIATVLEGSQYLLRYMQAAGVAGILVAGFAYIGSLVVATLAAVRARRVRRLGT